MKPDKKNRSIFTVKKILRGVLEYKIEKQEAIIVIKAFL